MKLSHLVESSTGLLPDIPTAHIIKCRLDCLHKNHHLRTKMDFSIHLEGHVLIIFWDKCPFFCSYAFFIFFLILCNGS